MITLQKAQLSKGQCRKELDELKVLLHNEQNISETEMLKFFRDRPQLILLMGRTIGVDAPRKYNDELPIIGKYRADFVVADESQSTFSFIEFEDAREDSIFKKTINKKTQVFPWAPRFEHGYSQVIDWYIHLATNDQSLNMKAEFGSMSINYFGALIIGREQSLSRGDCRERFRQRVNKTLIDSRHIVCYTFDELYSAMEDQYDILAAFS